MFTRGEVVMRKGVGMRELRAKSSVPRRVKLRRLGFWLNLLFWGLCGLATGWIVFGGTW